MVNGGPSRAASQAAAFLARRRAKKLTPERLSEIGKEGGDARAEALTKAERKRIATKASLAAAKARTKRAAERKRASRQR